MSDLPPNDRGQMRCLRCRSLQLEHSGMEPYRYICKGCGQHFLVVMQLVPVEPKRVAQLEGGVAERSPGSS